MPIIYFILFSLSVLFLLTLVFCRDNNFSQCTIRDYPYINNLQLQLLLPPNIVSNIFCGGLIVHYTWIVTVASCILDYPEKHILIISGQLGKNYFTQFTHSQEFIYHPKFSGFNKLNDIALIRVENSFKRSQFVDFLPRETKQEFGIWSCQKYPVIAGWYKGKPPTFNCKNVHVDFKCGRNIKEVSLACIYKDNNKCQNYYLPKNINRYFHKNDRGSIAPIGSALVCDFKGKRRVWGMIVETFHCDNNTFGDIALNIMNYHSFINQITKQVTNKPTSSVQSVNFFLLIIPLIIEIPLLKEI